MPEPRQPRFMYDTRLTFGARIYLAEVYKYYQTPVDFIVDDSYYATLFGLKDDRQVRRWRTELKRCGYIKEELNRFGKKKTTYEPDINNRIEDEILPMRIIFKTKEGKIITNTIEAFNYFDGLIDNSKLPVKNASKLRSFCHIFANSLFDERFYNIQLSKANQVMTEEFYQFIIFHFSIEIVYSTAMKVMDKFEKIVNLNLYVLTSLANLFKGDFELSKEHPGYKKHREEFRKEAEAYWALKGVKNEDNKN